MRGLPGTITRRHVVTTLAVVASGGAVGAAMAAGPVVYSEYTQGSGDDDRQARIVQGDGSGDVRLPSNLISAAVSPDGLRVAQVGLTSKRDSYVSTLRVSAGDGSAPVTLAERRATDGQRSTPEIITGPPVWSPDGRQIVVRVTRVNDQYDARRFVCVVDARTCRESGRLPRRAASTRDADLPSDVVGWQVVDGPLVDAGPLPGSDDDGAVTLRCGAPARTVAAPTTTVSGLAASAFGPPLTLRGLRSDDDEGDRLSPESAGVLTTADGTLAYDAPDAQVRRGALRCKRGRDRDDVGTESVALRSSAGRLRLRLRAGGRTTLLPPPAGLRRGDGLRLVGTDSGGALLVTAPTPALRDTGFCTAGAGKNRRRCFTDLGTAGRPPHRFVLRVWRYRPGSGRFERVTTLGRSALATLADATELAAATGDAVVAADGRTIERVPLDGGPPTTLARGREISLDIG